MWRKRAHWVERKKGCVFTSEAPAREPIRRSSSLIRSFRMRDLQRLEKDKLVLTVINPLEVFSRHVLGYLWRSRKFGESWVVPEDVGERSISIFPFERSCAVEHLVD